MIFEKEQCAAISLSHDGKILSINQEFRELFGFSKERLIGQPISSIVNFFEANDALLITQEEYTRPVMATIKNASGSHHKVMLLLDETKSSFSDLKSFLVTFLEPPTPPEIELSSLNVFKEVFEQAAIGVALVNPDGSILKANSAFENYLGYTEKELQNLTFQEFTHKDDLNKDVKYYNQLLSGEIDSYQMEKRYITKDKQVIWVELSVSLMRNDRNKMTYALAVVQNIQERKVMELKLSNSKARFEKAFKGAREAVWHWLDVNSDEEWWSPSFYEILGYDHKEIAPTINTFKNMLHPNDRKRVEAAMIAHLQDNSIFDINYRLKTKSGKYKWVNAKARAERDKHGKPLEMIGIIADIDHIKQTDKLLQERNDALENSNKELENFAYVASHDLQEPLRTINSFLQLFQMSLDTPLNEEAVSYLATVSQASLRMRQLIEDLLQYSRVSKTLQLDTVDLNDLLEEVLSCLTVQIEQSAGKISISTLPSVYGDRNKLYRLFNNLISNALKFRDSTRPPLVEITATSADTRIYLSVKDNGIGIDPSYYDTVFEIFKRLHTREEYPGSGIGLSVCKKIIELHSGKISITSTLGKGTTFIFDLPKT